MVKKIFLLLFITWSAAQSSWAQESTTYSTPYFVELHNGERVFARRIQYKSPIFKQNHFLLDDSVRIIPETVKYFQNQEGYFARVNAGRRYNDFAQREQTGRVSTYFVIKTDYSNAGPSIGVGMGGYGMGGYGGGYPTQRKVYYYSKENGPLEPLTYRNLRVSLADNAGSLEALQQYKRGQNIQTGLYIAGAGIMVAGLQQQFRGNTSSSSFSPLLLVGLGVTLLPQVLKLVRGDRLSEAIDLYNYQPVN